MQASGPPVGASRKTRVVANGETTSISSERNIRAICAIERGVRRDRSLPVRVSDAITRFAGTTLFLAIHALWFGGGSSGTVAFSPSEFLIHFHSVS
jgi:hypothetical protein